MKQFRIGLVIGRFQPFHKGHVYLIQKALTITDNIIIAIGSSNKKDENNPWDAQKRREMIELYIQSNNLQNKVLSIVDLPDHPDDDVWFENVRKRLGKFDVAIGNNDWVKGIFEGEGIPVVTVDHCNRGVWEGYKIRQLMRQKKKWEDRVPEYLVNKIQQGYHHL